MASAHIEHHVTRIYGLADPRDGCVRYVGKTKGALRTRRNAHVSDVKRGRTFIPRHRWLKSLLDAGITPEIIEIDIVSTDGWQEAEQFWIAYLRSLGCDLLNATAGGDGIHDHRHSEETKRRQREAALRRYSDPEEHAKTGEAVRRGQSSESYQEFIRTKQHFKSPEHLRKFLENSAAKSRDPAERQKRAERMRTRTVSEETKRKISAARTGKKATPEQRAKMSASRMGRRHSPGTRAKIKAAHIARKETTSREIKARWQDPQYREKVTAGASERTKAFWADPVNRERRIQQMRVKRVKSD
ncbi:MAG: NUMOD3 domain-containing DNA-binding protein [Minisyncoccota bacterium]